MSNFAATGDFEQVLRPTNVDILIGEGVLDGRPNTGLGSQMNDGVVVASQLVRQAIGVSQVGFHQAPTRIRSMIADVPLLESTVVKRVEILEDGDLLAFREERIDNVASDETGAAGNQDVHTLR